MPSSCRFVLPIRIAPASRSRPQAGASSVGTLSARNGDAAVVGTPAVATLSLTATGTPPSGPGRGATASDRALSRQSLMKQFSRPSSRPIRSSTVSTSSPAGRRRAASRLRNAVAPAGSDTVRLRGHDLGHVQARLVEASHRGPVRPDALEHLRHQVLGYRDKPECPNDPSQVVGADLTGRSLLVHGCLPTAVCRADRSVAALRRPLTVSTG